MPTGLDICKASEGCARAIGRGLFAAYWDDMGSVWTVGYGTTGAEVGAHTVWTQEQCDAKLVERWNVAKAGVLRASPVLASYPDKLDACTDFAYNLGIGAYQTSTLRRYVNQQRWADAANEFEKWNHAGGRAVAGLTRRRAAEKALFLATQQVDQIKPENVVVSSSSNLFSFNTFIKAFNSFLSRFFGR